MTLNSKRSQNILIGVLAIALITTFSVEAMQTTRENNQSTTIVERAPIKNSLKDYVVEKVDIIQEIENEPEVIVEDEVIEDVVEEYIPEETVNDDSNSEYYPDYSDGDSEIITPPTGVDIPDDNTSGNDSEDSGLTTPVPPENGGNDNNTPGEGTGEGTGDGSEEGQPGDGGETELPNPPEGEGAIPETPNNGSGAENPELP